MKTMDQITIKNKVILLIVDYNIKDDNTFKIQQTLPTIEYILNKGPKMLFILTHLGRPSPIYKYINNSSNNNSVNNSNSSSKDVNTNTSINTNNSNNNTNVNSNSSTVDIFHILRNISSISHIKYMPLNQFKIKNGLFFGDNSRFYDSLRDFYCNFDEIVYDAFGTIHRIDEFKGCAGLLMKKEIEILKTVEDCDLLIMGGAKISEKIKLIDKFDNKDNNMKVSDNNNKNRGILPLNKKNTRIFLGGGLCTSLYKNMGYEIGEKTIHQQYNNINNNKIYHNINNRKIILPEDFKVVEEDGSYKNKDIGTILKTDKIIDIGEKSIKILEELIEESKFILWNGPLGYFEDPEAISTREMIRKLEENKDRTRVIAGGGETVNAIVKYGNIANFYHVSTGGGAMLSFLVGEAPGLKSIE